MAETHAGDGPRTYRQAMLEAKRAYLLELLTRTKGNVTRAARLAACRRPNFYRLLKDSGIDILQHRGAD